MKLEKSTMKLFSAVILIFAICTVNAQTSKEKRRQAAEELMETYKSVSIDPYRGMTEAEWNERAWEFLARIDSAKTNAELLYALRYFGLLASDGHFDFPDTGVYNREKVFSKDDRIFPVMVHTTRDDRVFVVRDYSGSIPDHAELLEINGRPAGELSREQHRIVPYEPDYAYGWLNEAKERSFKTWVSFANYLFCEGMGGPFAVRYAADGTEHTKAIDAVERQTLHKRSRTERKGVGGLQFFGNVMDYTRRNDSVAVLDIDYFWGKNPFTFMFSKTDTRFERVLRRHMKRVRRDGISHLVVDLRGNAGGYTKNAYTLMSYFAPDMVYDDKTTYKVSEAAKIGDRGARILESSIEMVHGKNNESLRRQTVELYKSMPAGTIFREDTLMSMAYRAPRPRHPYRGKVYVLTNATTFSASIIFCNYFRKSGVGLIAGEAPGGYSQVTGGARIPVKNRLADWIPMRVPHTVINPLDLDEYSRLQPDVPIENDFDRWLKGEDSTLDELLDMIVNGTI